MASTAYIGTVFAFWVLLLSNFMYFNCFHVFHKEFLWPTDANKYQMGFSINILYHRHQELLECQTFTAYLLTFIIFSNSGNFIGFAVDL